MSDATPEEKPASEATAPTAANVRDQSAFIGESEDMFRTACDLAAEPWQDETLRLRAIVFLTNSAIKLRAMEHASDARIADTGRREEESDAAERAIEREERLRAEERAIERETRDREEKRIQEERLRAIEHEAETVRRQDAAEARGFRRHVTELLIGQFVAADTNGQPIDVEKAIAAAVKLVEVLKSLEGV